MSTEAAAQTDSTSDSAAPAPGSQSEQAHRIVRRNVYWALGVGLVPVPYLDFVAMSGVQVKMIKELADLYQVNFFEEKAKTIISSLITGLGTVTLTMLAAGSLFKIVPGLGSLVGAVGNSVFGGALTLATGNLFTMHFASGGTLLNFEPDKMRDYFRNEFDNAKGTVGQLQKTPMSSSGVPERP